MRSFLITAILFSLLIVIIIINSIYTQKTAEKLENRILALNIDEDLSDELAEIEAYWKKQEKILGISVGFKELDKMNELLISLKISYQYQNRQEFDKVKLLINDILKEITRLENFSLR